MQNMNSIWIPVEKIQTPLYQENLRFLAAFDPSFFQKITVSSNPEQLEIQNVSGLICCRTISQPHEYVFGKVDPQQEAKEMQARIKSELLPQQLFLLLGSSCGYTLQGILPFLLNHPEFRAVWIEPTAARIALVLHFIDIRSALQTGRFHISIAENQPEELCKEIEKHQLWNQPNPTLFHPAKTDHQDWHDSFVSMYEMHSANHIKNVNSIIESIAKNNSQPNTIQNVLLIDCWQNAVQRIHIQSIENAFKKRGVKTKHIAIDGCRIDLCGSEYRRLIEPRILRACHELQPDLIISYAYHATHLLQRKHFEEMNIPWLQVVSNLVFQDQGYYPNEYTALCEKKLITDYQKRGAHHLFYVPIMANHCVDEPPKTDHTIPIAFVGNSLGLHPNEAQSFLAQIKTNDTLYRYVLLAENEVGTFDHRINLFDYMEQNPIPIAPSSDDWYHVFRYLLCQTTQQRRTSLLESIADLGLHVYGNWKDKISTRSPLRSCLKGFLPFEHEQKLFQHTSLFVNIHSSANADCPNMRFFNTAGLGGMQITDGSFDHFLVDQKETIYYHSVEEFRTQVEYYLHHPQEAETIREQAIVRIKKDWTYDNWLDEVLQNMGYTLSSNP